ncbi:YajQ family cyclic di-GMP-binding protein [Candidatus Peregrinibacteria bacterium]|nr:YajQ family cyclic di-GMP-binding protein [Candidatus Peregrinibacteria bacterium]
MASEHTMDIVVRFDFQELVNAVDQAKREALNRFDLKDSNVEIELNDESIKITAPSNIQIESVFDILSKKMIGRNLSTKILKRKDIQEIGGMRARLEITLIKALDQENAKKISKIIRDEFPKTKPMIQGDAVRVASKSIDDLQAIMTKLRGDESLNIPLDFTNYR